MQRALKEAPSSKGPFGGVDHTRPREISPAVQREVMRLVEEIVVWHLGQTVAYVQASTISTKRGTRMPLMDALILDQGSRDDAISLVQSVAMKRLTHKTPAQRATLDLMSHLRKSRRKDLSAHARQRDDGVDLRRSPSHLNSPLQEAERKQLVEKFLRDNPKVAAAIGYWYAGDTKIVAAEKAGIGVSTLRKYIAAIAKSLKPMKKGERGN